MVQKGCDPCNDALLTFCYRIFEEHGVLCVQWFMSAKWPKHYLQS